MSNTPPSPRPGLLAEATTELGEFLAAEGGMVGGLCCLLFLGGSFLLLQAWSNEDPHLLVPAFFCFGLLVLILPLAFGLVLLFVWLDARAQARQEQE